MPAIAILLPVRDAMPYLGGCLASLWRQTLCDFHVIAVDDGSSCNRHSCTITLAWRW